MSADMVEGLQFVHERLDQIANMKYEMYGIGVSMGANLLLRY